MKYEKQEDEYQHEELSPEKRMMLAVIERAILDVRAGSEDAFEWFHSEVEEPMSFLWVCACLDVRPERILRLVEKAKRGDQRKRISAIRGRHKQRMEKAALLMTETLQMHKDGLSVREIMQHTQMSETSVRKTIVAAGGKPRMYNRNYLMSFVEEGYSVSQIARIVRGKSSGAIQTSIIFSLAA